jgi:hypothetical protein
LSSPTPQTGLLPQPPQDPPQLAPPDQLPAMNNVASSEGSSNDFNESEGDCPLISWFAIRVVHKPNDDDEEQEVEGLTLNVKLSNAPDQTRVTAKESDNKISALSPGGTGQIVSTDHSDSVWEVETDIP